MSAYTVNRRKGRDRTQRFREKVQQGSPDECWPWLASCRKGYGQFSDGRGVMLPAHKVAWVLERGEVPAGLSVLHQCDNRKCCNVRHLYLGTQTDNMADVIRRGRQGKRLLYRGEVVSTALLTAESVIEIRRRYAQGELQKDLAAAFGVGTTTIGAIVTRRSWKHF